MGNQRRASEEVTSTPVTRVELLAEGVIEAGWLVALAVVPLFNNIYSRRQYEPDKIAIFRSIVVVMVAAWLWKVLSGGRSHASSAPVDGSRKPLLAKVKGFLSVPLAGAVVVLAISIVVSSALSVDPRMSWLGTYTRFAGAWTQLAYLVFFGLVASHLRSRLQWRRAAFVIVLTASTVALYAILQTLDLDPRWVPQFGTRVYSSLGNPIFLGGYLVMTVFVTGWIVGQLMVERRRGPTTGPTRRFMNFKLVIAGLALFAQLVAIVLSQSRGPVVGLAAGGYVMFLATIARLRSVPREEGRPPTRFTTSAWLGGVAVTVAGLVLMIGVAVPGSPLSSLRDIPYAGRIATALDFESSSSQVRLNIWRSIVDRFGSDQPIQVPDEAPDSLDAWRPLIGYGPETLKAVTVSHLPPYLEERGRVPDRAHNETLDVLATQGGFGYAVWLVLYGGVFVICLGGIGMLGSQRRRVETWLALTGGAAAGVVVPRLVTGEWASSGVGLAAGLIVGLTLLVTVRSAPRSRTDEIAARPGPAFWLSLTLMATMIAHVAEVHFGIAISATRVYFWFLAAVLLALALGAPGRGRETPDEPAAQQRRNDPKRRTKSQPGRRDGEALRVSDRAESLALGILIAIVVAPLAYLMILNVGGRGSAVTVLEDALSSVADPAASGAGAFIWLLIWVFAASAALIPARGREPTSFGFPGWSIALAAAGAVAYIIYQASRVARVARVSATDVPEAVHLVLGYLDSFFVLVLAVVLATGIAIGWTHVGFSARDTGVNWRSVVSAVMLAVIAAVVVIQGNIDPIRADMLAKQGVALSDEGSSALGLDLMEEATEIASGEATYFTLDAIAAIDAAAAAPTSEEREVLLDRAEGALARAIELTPLEANHYTNMARHLHQSLDGSTDLEGALPIFEEASDYYSAARFLRPDSPLLLRGHAVVIRDHSSVLRILGREAEADELEQRASTLEERAATLEAAF